MHDRGFSYSDFEVVTAYPVHMTPNLGVHTQFVLDPKSYPYKN